MKKEEQPSYFKKDTFGTCAYDHTSPPRENFTNQTKIVNVLLSFEEALKLNLAIDECVRKLNRYKKSTKIGKSAALLVAVHLELNRISIHESKL